MQIWQLFIILRHSANISVTVSTNSTKLTNDLLILPIELVGPTVTRLVQEPLAVLLLDNRLYIVVWSVTKSNINKFLVWSNHVHC